MEIFLSRKIKQNSTKFDKINYLPYLKLLGKLFLAILVPICIMLFVYVIDPLQFFRPAKAYMPRFYTQERFQNPAIAHSFSYDTVICGTSMSQNVSLRTLRETYGFNPIRQTFAGSSAFEQASGLNVAIKTGQVKSVIWELNFTSFGGEVDTPKDSKAVFPDYLYNENCIDNYKYLLDPVQIRRAWQVVTNWLPYNGVVTDYESENLNKWESWFTYGEDIVVADFKDRLNKGEFEPNEKLIEMMDIDKIKENIEVNVEKFVRENPQIEWIFCFAPFSALEHVAYEMQGILENELFFRQAAFYSLSKYENVKFFDFQGDVAFVENLDNYKDSMHYKAEVTNSMLYYMLNYEDTTAEEFEINQIYLKELAQKWKSVLI